MAVVLLALMASVPTLPARAVTVTVAPAGTTVMCGIPFTLRITSGVCPDFKGFTLVFSFDPTKLGFLGVEPGDVLTGSGNPLAGCLVPDTAPPDTVWYDATMLAGSSSGPGILAFFRFQGFAEGESPVQCERVDYRDSNNVQTLPVCVSGPVRITGRTPARAASWGSIETPYR